MSEPRGAVDSDPGVTYLELSASFEISMGVPLPSRVGQSSKSGKALAWEPFDTTFGVDDTWADKAAVLHSACVQLTRFVSRPVLQGDNVAMNVGLLHGVQGYRMPVAALTRRMPMRPPLSHDQEQQQRMRILAKPPWILAPILQAVTDKGTTWAETMTARPVMGSEGMLTIALGEHDNFEIVASTIKAIYDQTCRSCGLINRILIYMRRRPNSSGSVLTSVNRYSGQAFLGARPWPCYVEVLLLSHVLDGPPGYEVPRLEWASKAPADEHDGGRGGWLLAMMLAVGPVWWVSEHRPAESHLEAREGVGDWFLQLQPVVSIARVFSPYVWLICRFWDYASMGEDKSKSRLHIAADHMFEEKDVVESVQVKEPPEDVSKVRVVLVGFSPLDAEYATLRDTLGDPWCQPRVVNVFAVYAPNFNAVAAEKDAFYDKLRELLGRSNVVEVPEVSEPVGIAGRSRETPVSFLSAIADGDVDTAVRYRSTFAEVDSMQVVQVMERLTRRVREQLKEVVAFYQSDRDAVVQGLKEKGAK
ncbi:unnamed protein product [Symbiodinium microadriaticum]|nr:unnamed protein product [Symbiodinium microadriaticum]CAE7738757.1 unnamed protein product [Symbiodinium sp. KB8]